MIKKNLKIHTRIFSKVLFQNLTRKIKKKTPLPTVFLNLKKKYRFFRVNLKKNDIFDVKEVLEKAKSTKTPAQNVQLIKLYNQNICFSSLRGCEITPKINILLRPTLYTAMIAERRTE